MSFEKLGEIDINIDKGNVSCPGGGVCWAGTCGSATIGELGNNNASLNANSSAS